MSSNELNCVLLLLGLAFRTLMRSTHRVLSLFTRFKGRVNSAQDSNIPVDQSQNQTKTEFLGDQIAKTPRNGLMEGQGVMYEYIFRLICPPQFI